MKSHDDGVPANDTRADESEGDSQKKEEAERSSDSESSKDDWNRMQPAFADPDVTVEIDYSATSGEMADLMGVNRGVLTMGRYGTPDSSDWPADFTRLYQAIGITSVRTHGDCFDVASIFGLLPEDEVANVDDLPVIHSIELLEYRDDQGAPITAAVDRKIIRDDIHDGWKYLFESNNRELIWDQTNLWQLVEQIELHVAADSPALIPLRMATSADPPVPSWLFWHPKSGEVANDSFYRTNTTGAAAAYRALVDAGIEVYFRVGESMGGPTYVTERLLSGDTGTLPGKAEYADVAQWVLEYLIASTRRQEQDGAVFRLPRPPHFVEIWNEPDGEFYADIHGASAEDFGADFFELCTEIEQRFRSLSFPGYAEPPVGGCGFTRGGMSNFIDKFCGMSTYSKVYEILEQSQSDSFDFVSFHWYSQPSDEPVISKRDVESPWAPSMGGLEQPWVSTLEEDFVHRALAFASDLSRFTAGLRSFYSSSGVACPEIHVSEWNIQLPAETTEDDCEKNWCVGIEGAAFVSAAMTWMQCSEVGVSRAHFFAGRDKDGGLFHFKFGNETMAHFKIRPSAIAFFLYSDLAGQHRVPVTVEHSSVIDAALDGKRVTAIAFMGDGPVYPSFILTNLSPLSRRVNMRISGLPPATYQVTSTNIDSGIPHGGIIILRGDLESSGDYPDVDPVKRFRPKEGVARAAIESVLQQTTLGTFTYFGQCDSTDFGIEIPAHGVMRVQITQSRQAL